MKNFILVEKSPIERKLTEENKLIKMSVGIYMLKNVYFKNGRGDLSMKGEKLVVKDGGPYRF